jgi:hypothetical protein
VGSAGSEDKVEWLLDELKVDYAFNYRKLQGKGTAIEEENNNNISSELKKHFQMELTFILIMLAENI